MPVELHERLSEFSYDYGITHETELALASLGVQAVPFLPSLLHEAELGFDVGFNRPGLPLLLQFKLGQAMRRFKPGPGPPRLNRPYWRFHIDTAEPDGQFELLLKAEQDGAETYYTASRFHDWEAYLSSYSDGTVLENSLLLQPTQIRSAMDAHGIYPRRVGVDGVPDELRYGLDELRASELPDVVALNLNSVMLFTHRRHRHRSGCSNSWSHSPPQIFLPGGSRRASAHPDGSSRPSGKNAEGTLQAFGGGQPSERYQRIEAGLRPP